MTEHIGIKDPGEAIKRARSHIGDPYKWGGEGPHSWDCSGLVCDAYKITPRTNTAELIKLGTNIRQADLRPGDLVFPNPHHVQIYTGKGKIIEAPRTGEDVRERAMWGYWHARRIVNAHANPPLKNPPKARSNLYTVKRGDTLSEIALRLYGKASRYTVIAAANHIKPPYVIQIGQKLRIP